MAQKLWPKNSKSSQLDLLEVVGIIKIYSMKRKSLMMHSGARPFLKKKSKMTITKPSLMFQICTTTISIIRNPMPMTLPRMKKKQPIQRKGAAKRSLPFARANGKHLLYHKKICYKKLQLPRYSTEHLCNSILSSRMRKEGS